MIMQVTVVIPVHNAALYLEQAVCSALEQPETAEVILIEDGSSDDSLSVCEKLTREHLRVRLLRHSDGRNRGAAASRNLGIVHASCEYVAFLDADDYFLPNRFAATREILINNEAIDGVYEAAEVEHSDGLVRSRYQLDSPLLMTLSKRVSPDRCFEALLIDLVGGMGNLPTDGIVVRRSLFDQVGLFDENMPRLQDTAMWLKMSAVGKLAGGKLGSPIARYRVYPRTRPEQESVEARVYNRKLLFQNLWEWGRARRLEKQRQSMLLLLAASSEIPKHEGASYPRRLCNMVFNLAKASVSCPSTLASFGLWRTVLHLATHKLVFRLSHSNWYCSEKEDETFFAGTQNQLSFSEASAHDAQDAVGKSQSHFTDKSMEVSVIIPVYNAASYLEQAVSSALEQPETAEVILIEDGSSDDSLSVCEKLTREHLRVRLLRHSDGRNRGAAASRNLGIVHASCEYVAFLDADDYFLPNRFAATREILINNEAIDGVYEAAEVEHSDGLVRSRYQLDSPLLMTLSKRVSPDRCFEALLIDLVGGMGNLPTDGIVVRRSLFDRVGLFDENMPRLEDTAMWLKMSAVGKLAGGKLGSPIARYRVYPRTRPEQESVEARVYNRKLLFQNLWEWGRARRLEKQRQSMLLLLAASSEIPKHEGASYPRRLCGMVFNLAKIGIGHPSKLFEMALWRLIFRLIVEKAWHASDKGPLKPYRLGRSW